jgi:hypothetical protein
MKEKHLVFLNHLAGTQHNEDASLYTAIGPRRPATFASSPPIPPIPVVTAVTIISAIVTAI